MRAHAWESEEVDGGHVGVGDFWKCRACGASGGPNFDFMSAHPTPPPTFPPFIGDGSGVKVSDDCDEAKRQIDHHRATWTPPRW